MGIPVYWSLSHTTAAPATLKTTLKQTQPTQSSIRPPGRRRRRTYSDIVRNGDNELNSILERLPVVPATGAGGEADESGVSANAAERERRRRRELERNARMVAEYRAQAATLTRLARRVGGVGDDEEEEEEDSAPEGGYALTRARAIHPFNPRAATRTAPAEAASQGSSSAAAGGWDISEFLSWMSNPSDTTSPPSASSTVPPLGSSHVPPLGYPPPGPVHPVDRYPGVFEIPIVDEDTSSDSEVGAGVSFRDARVASQEALEGLSGGQEEFGLSGWSRELTHYHRMRNAEIRAEREERRQLDEEAEVFRRGRVWD